MAVALGSSAGSNVGLLAEDRGAAFLLALKDVVEATGGVGEFAERVGLKRPSLYRILPKHANPTWPRCGKP